MKFKLARGFTLVELLIVIGLLGAIALIVISAINPIEQANKARDARYKADASQMISAVERYYASNSKFPWEQGVNCQTSACTVTSSEEFSFITAADPAIGLCSAAGCNAGGTLITSNELKNEFLGRDWIKATTDDLRIFIGKGTGSSSSVFACFIPRAKATQDAAGDNETVRSLSFSNGLPTENESCTSSEDDWAANDCYICIPE